MHSKVFIILIVALIGVVVATSPPILQPLLAKPATVTATVVVASPTATLSPTKDPFAHVPTATRVGGDEGVGVVQHLEAPALGQLPPTFTPAAQASLPTDEVEARVILPDTLATRVPVTEVRTTSTLVIPTPAGTAPDRLQIPRLSLDAPVDQVDLIPSGVTEGVYEWGVPDYRAAGWLETSAPFGKAGNTILDGHHNIQGEVFRDLWTLRPGDEIILSAEAETKTYRVDEVLILPERDQPLEVRLKNAEYIQPTDDERLTLITCWPYNDNTHRAVVIAFPESGGL